VPGRAEDLPAHAYARRLRDHPARLAAQLSRAVPGDRTRRSGAGSAFASRRGIARQRAAIERAPRRMVTCAAANTAEVVGPRSCGGRACPCTRAGRSRPRKASKDRAPVAARIVRRRRAHTRGGLRGAESPVSSFASSFSGLHGAACSSGESLAQHTRAMGCLTYRSRAGEPSRGALRRARGARTRDHYRRERARGPGLD
jgi:hypothetical protein